MKQHTQNTLFPCRGRYWLFTILLPFILAVIVALPEYQQGKLAGSSLASFFDWLGRIDHSAKDSLASLEFILGQALLSGEVWLALPLIVMACLFLVAIRAAKN